MRLGYGMIVAGVALALPACGGDDGGTGPDLPVVDIERLDANDVLTVIDSRGVLGQDPLPVQGVGFFPAGSPNNYVFGTGFWLGGLVNGAKSVYSTYDANGGRSDSNLGRASGGGGERILCSDSGSDLDRWYDEFSSGGSPVVLGDEDCVVIYNDATQAGGRTPIGFEVRQRTVTFTSGLLSQVVFVIWEVVNVGPNVLEQAFFAVNADFDIGVDIGDDRCSAIAAVPPGANNPTGATVETDLVFCWDDDFIEVNFDPNPPGFVGVSLLRGASGEGGADLGLTDFFVYDQERDEGPAFTPDAEQYDLLSGLARPDEARGDKRFLAISGPFRLASGGTQRIVVAYVWADVVGDLTQLIVDPTRCFPGGSPCFLPDPNDPALRELIDIQQAAQAARAGFGLP